MAQTHRDDLFQEYLDGADVRPDRLDLRDRLYQPPVVWLSERAPHVNLGIAIASFVDAGMVRDQRRDGACTGYGVAAVIDFLYWQKALKEEMEERQQMEATALGGQSLQGEHQKIEDLIANLASSLKEKFTQVSARMLYHVGRFYDEWSGEEHSGSSLRGVMKAWQRHGVCAESLWESPWPPFKSPKKEWAEDAATRPLGVYYRVNRSSIVDMQAAIHQVGAIAASGYFHKNWRSLLHTEFDRRVIASLTHAGIERIEWSPEIDRAGMHAFAIVGYNESGFIIQNSWGEAWGSGGFAVLGYEDWNANGVDAWVAALGVPVEQRDEALRVYIDSRNPQSRYKAPDGDDQLALDAGLWKRGTEVSTRIGAQAQQPTDSDVQRWSVQQCYEHAVILGSNGRAVNRLIEMESANVAARYIAYELPVQKFANWHGSQKVKAKIAIYALSGLKPDREELQRIASLGPYFEANRVYPIFVGWRNGFLDPFLALAGKQIMAMLTKDRRMIEILLGERDQQAIETWDQTMESIFESRGGKPMWTQLKQDALLSAQRTRLLRRAAKDEKEGTIEQGALHLLADGLGSLRKEWPNLEIHFVGHSAGAIVLSHLLAALGRAISRPEGSRPVASCTLFAPACSIFIANWRFRYYMTKNPLMNPLKFKVHVLSEELEKEDCLGPYNKSFLYLVSNALEDWGPIPSKGEIQSKGTPILGMHNAATRGYWHPATAGESEEWRQLCQELKIPKVSVWPKDRARSQHQEDPQVPIAPNTFIAPSHDSFPENVELANETLLRITRGKTLRRTVGNLNWRA